jgi:hypothetical protein
MHGRSDSKKQQRTKKKRKRLKSAVICIIKFEKRRTWEKFVFNLQEDYKGNKFLHAVMRNNMKPKLNYAEY